MNIDLEKTLRESFSEDIRKTEGDLLANSVDKMLKNPLIKEIFDIYKDEVKQEAWRKINIFENNKEVFLKKIMSLDVSMIDKSMELFTEIISDISNIQEIKNIVTDFMSISDFAQFDVKDLSNKEFFHYILGEKFSETEILDAEKKFLYLFGRGNNLSNGVKIIETASTKILIREGLYTGDLYILGVILETSMGQITVLINGEPLVIMEKDNGVVYCLQGVDSVDERKFKSFSMFPLIQPYSAWGVTKIDDENFELKVSENKNICCQIIDKNKNPIFLSKTLFYRDTLVIAFSDREEKDMLKRFNFSSSILNPFFLEWTKEELKIASDMLGKPIKKGFFEMKHLEKQDELIELLELNSAI